MLVVSIRGSFEEGLRGIKKAISYADAVEFRLDLMEEETAILLRKKCPLSVIFKGKTLDLNPDYIDLPYDAECDVPSGIKVIRSYHNFEETPEDLEEILAQMKKKPAAIYKIATMAHSTLDALRMLTFVQKHPNVAGMCMGEKGAITRILGPVVGSALTFAAAEKGEETAPGQLTAQELQEIYRFRKLGPQTKVFALIGDPIDKSIGHIFHNEAFANEEAVYVKMAVKADEVAPFFQVIAPLPFYGLSVTMPLKERVGEGVINTLTRDGEKWIGSNTDGRGALDVLEKEGKVKGKKLLIIGAGGTAKAIAIEGKKRGAHILIANRTLEKGKALAEEVGGEFLPLEKVKMCCYDILVNATPTMPIDGKALRRGAVVLDVVAYPSETPLLKEAAARGCFPLSGTLLFRSQGEKQLETWNWGR